jgi:hypothetical protein
MSGLPIPTPVFLDTSVLQAVSDHGEFVFENVDPPADARIRQVPGGLGELDALRRIFLANQRNALPMAISQHSLAEVADRRKASYLSWAFEVHEWSQWLGIRDDHPTMFLTPTRFGYLSAKDRALLEDSLRLGCRAFLTMERRLPRNRLHLRKTTGLEVLRPTAFWSLVEPWAALLV